MAWNQGGGARRHVADGIAVIGANFDQTFCDMHAVAHWVDGDSKCRPLHHGGKQGRLHAEVRLPLPIDLERAEPRSCKTRVIPPTSGASVVRLFGPTTTLC